MANQSLIKSFKSQLKAKGVPDSLAEKAAKDLANGLTAATSNTLREAYSLITL